jgi:hypothetical protein
MIPKTFENTLHYLLYNDPKNAPDYDQCFYHGYLLKENKRIHENIILLLSTWKSFDEKKPEQERGEYKKYFHISLCDFVKYKNNKANYNLFDISRLNTPKAKDKMKKDIGIRYYDLLYEENKWIFHDQYYNTVYTFPQHGDLKPTQITGLYLNENCSDFLICSNLSSQPQSISFFSTEIANINILNSSLIHFIKKNENNRSYVEFFGYKRIKITAKGDVKENEIKEKEVKEKKQKEDTEPKKRGRKKKEETDTEPKKRGRKKTVKVEEKEEKEEEKNERGKEEKIKGKKRKREDKEGTKDEIKKEETKDIKKNPKKEIFKKLIENIDNINLPDEEQNNRENKLLDDLKIEKDKQKIKLIKKKQTPAEKRKMLNIQLGTILCNDNISEEEKEMKKKDLSAQIDLLTENEQEKQKQITELEQEIDRLIMEVKIPQPTKVPILMAQIEDLEEQTKKLYIEVDVFMQAYKREVHEKRDKYIFQIQDKLRILHGD